MDASNMQDKNHGNHNRNLRKVESSPTSHHTSNASQQKALMSQSNRMSSQQPPPLRQPILFDPHSQLLQSSTKSNQSLISNHSESLHHLETPEPYGETPPEDRNTSAPQQRRVEGPAQDSNENNEQYAFDGQNAFFIDVSPLMVKYCTQLEKIVEYMWSLLKCCSPDLPCFYFSDGSKTQNLPTNTSQMLKSLSDHLHGQNRTIFAETFAAILRKYCQQFGKTPLLEKLKHPRHKSSKRPRKFSLYVLTDGIWERETNLVPEIKVLADQLKMHGITDNQIGIQFIQFGNHPQGSIRLRTLASVLHEKP
ncbi:MAG: hypothetical protein Q9214_006554, partial [Letrouitia sp. 1 TL-2023]